MSDVGDNATTVATTKIMIAMQVVMLVGLLIVDSDQHSDCHCGNIAKHPS